MATTDVTAERRRDSDEQATPPLSRARLNGHDSAREPGRGHERAAPKALQRTRTAKEYCQHTAEAGASEIHFVFDHPHDERGNMPMRKISTRPLVQVRSSLPPSAKSPPRNSAGCKRTRHARKRQLHGNRSCHLSPGPLVNDITRRHPGCREVSHAAARYKMEPRTACHVATTSRPRHLSPGPRGNSHRTPAGKVTGAKRRHIQAPQGGVKRCASKHAAGHSRIRSTKWLLTLYPNWQRTATRRPRLLSPGQALTATTALRNQDVDMNATRPRRYSEQQREDDDDIKRKHKV